eukprot:g48166.t1
MQVKRAKHNEYLRKHRAKHNEYLRKHTVAPTSRLLLAQTAQKKCAELQNIASYKHIPTSRNFTFLTFPPTLFTRPSQNPGTGIQWAERSGSNPESKELGCRTGP